MSRSIPSTMQNWSKPIRLPDNIEITHTDPPFAKAGERSNWELPFKLSRNVLAGTKIMLELWCFRNNKGQLGIDISQLTAKLDDGSKLKIEDSTISGTYIIQLPNDRELKAGENLIIFLGNDNSKVKAPPERLLNKFFTLYDSPQGHPVNEAPVLNNSGTWTEDNQDRIISACLMHILGGETDQIRVYVPATTSPGKTFSVLIRPEDKLGNLSSEELGDIEISVNGEKIANKSEKVPSSNCLRAKINLSKEGSYRIHVRDMISGLKAHSNPTRCAETRKSVYWGMIHGHTEMSDGTGKLDQYFHQIKNEVALDFAATADHDHLYETSDAFWKLSQDAVKEWHEPNAFVTFLGYEWAKWRQNGDGDRNVYFLKDERPMYRSDDGEYPSPPDLFKVLEEKGEEAMIIPHHTAHGGNFCDWKDHDPKYERLVELFQVRGSFECSPEDGNPMAEINEHCEAFENGYVRNALELGWRVGFTGGGDDHFGKWGTESRFGDNNTAYKQGMMSVEADDLTRESIFRAMYERRVVATSGPRIILSFQVNGFPMGTELKAERNTDLINQRVISVRVNATAPIHRIEIIRNNKIVHTIRGNGGIDLMATWEDAIPLEEINLPPAKFCDNPFTFYYVRIIQEDGEMAWASPIWIDP